MAKKTKVLSKSAIAAALVAAAVVPVAAVPAAAAATEAVTEVVYSSNGQNASLSFETFTDALNAEVLTDLNIAYVKAADGKYYSFSDFSDAINATATIDEALAALTAKPELAKELTNVVEGKVSEDGKVVTETGSALKVDSVSAINPTTIKVTLSNDAVAANLIASNFTLSKGTVEGVTTVAGNAKEVLVNVKGLTYGDTTTVTVGSPAYTKEVTVPAVSDLFTLEITTDATNDTILSNGASKTQVTVTLKDKLTGKLVDKDGIVQFQATNGGLGQTTSALVDGKASVQLTSEASATSITSILTATISDVPGAGEFKGLTAQKTVIFSPNPVTDTTAQFVTPVSAEAKAADRLFVQFSSKITAAAYKTAINASTWNKATNGHGIAINDKLVNVKDVKQVTDNVLEFILDTDLATEARFTTINTHTRIEASWAGATFPATGSTTKNYLRDNVQHVVTFPQNVGNVVLANTTNNVKFILTDTSKPAVLGVTAKDQVDFTVRFTEAVDERTVEQLNGDKIAPHFLLNGKQVIVNPAATAGDVAAAKASNKIIVNKLEVGNYNATTGVDTRNLVNFELNSEFALGAGTHVIQIANVTDWAGDVDPIQNTVVTDTFSFDVAVDSSKPVAQITTDSPEQWFVAYDKPVITTTGKVAADVFKIKTGKSTDAELKYGEDFKVYVTDANGQAGRELTASSTISSSSQYFLIEFLHDWSVHYDTKANTSTTYFATTQNPYTVTLDNVRSLVGNAADKQELKVTLAYDGKSPVVATATDVYSTATKKYSLNEYTTTNGTTVKTSDEVKASGQFVHVAFDEPVKVNSTDAVPAEGLTASQDQFTNSGITSAQLTAAVTGTAKTSQGTDAQNKQAVQASTYEFVKGDQVIKADVAAGSVAANDKSLVLKPETQLEAGEWTLYIRAISDDIGNTISTTSTKVTIVPSAVQTTGTQVAWAAFDDAKGTEKRVDAQYADYDVVYVKFTKVMKADGANGVASTQNYVFRGQPLSTLGNDAQVIRGIKGVTNDWDGVTIVVPKGTWNGTNAAAQHGTADAPFSNFSAAFSVAENFVSVAGEKISGDYEFELTDTATTASGATTTVAPAPVGLVAFTGLGGANNSTNNTTGTAFEALYVQNNAGTLGSTTKAGVLNATATEKSASTPENGKIDQVTLTLDKSVTIAKDTQILVNGKKFSIGAADYTGTTPVFNALTNEEVDGTSTTNLTITTTNGAILVGTGAAADAAKPVVKSAAVADGKLKVTFSEPIKTTGSIAFDSYLQPQVAAGTALVATPALGNAIEIGTDYLVFSTASATTAFSTTAVTLDVLTAGPGSALKDAAGNDLVAIQGTAFANDVKISGLTGSTTPGTVVSGVTATSPTPTIPGMALVTGSDTTWSTVTGTLASPAVFTDATSKLKGFNIVFVDGGAAATTSAALAGNTFTVTVKTAGDTGTNVLTALKAATGVTTGTDTWTGLASLTVTNGTETIIPAAVVTYTAGVAPVTAVAQVSKFKIASPAVRTADLTVKVTVTPATGTAVTYTTTILAANVLAGTIAGDIASHLTTDTANLESAATATTIATYTDGATPPVAAPFTITKDVTDTTGQTLIITQTGTLGPVTYSVSVQ